MKACRIRDYDDDGPWWAINYDGSQLPDDWDPAKAMRPLNLGWEIADEARANFCERVIASNLKPANSGNVPPDLIIKNSSGPLFLSTRAREVLEQIEPGHDFVDFELFQRDHDDDGFGMAPPDRVVKRGLIHGLNSKTFLDCINYDATEWRDGTGEKNARSSGHNLPFDHKRGVVLKGDVIAGHHIWRGSAEKRQAIAEHFISSELLAAFDAAELTRNWYGEDCDVKTLVAAG